RRYAVSTVLTFIGVLPIGLDAVLHGGPVWVPPAGLGDLRLLVHTVAGDSRAYEYLVLAIAGLGVLLAVASNLPRFSTLPWVSPVKLGPATALASWLAVPILISFALTQPSLNLHLFYPRYLVVVVPPLCLLAGLGVQALPTRAAQAALAVALLLVAWPPLLHYYENSQVQDFKDPVAWMQERYQPGDGIVCDPVIECGIPVAYYLQVEP